MKAGTFLQITAIGFALTFASRAAEWKSEQWNCAVEYPDGWTLAEPPSPMIKLLARSADNSKMICVIVVEEAGLKGTGINDEYIGGLKRGFTGNGGTIISDQRMQLAGVPAYEVIGRIPAPGKTLSTKMHSTVADGRSYAVQIMDAEGDVTRDRQLGQIMATFHFLKPPKISPLDGRSAAFRIGYLFGRVGVVAVLVAVVVLIIRKARRPKPPPLPPA